MGVRGLKFQLYRRRSLFLRRAQWRWRLIALNGRTIADSGEGYNNRADAMKMIERIQALAPTADIIERSES